jgi:hypothetical protein
MGGRNQWNTQVKGEYNYLGVFAHIEEATASLKATQIEHGYHENHGMAH